MSQFLRHGPCPNCGSKDNLGIYTDHSFCFGCNYHTQTGEKTSVNKVFKPFKEAAWSNRKLTEESFRKFGSGISADSTAIIFNYYHEGEVVAQHTRTKDKQFRWVYDKETWSRPIGELPLFGQHLWKAGGRRLVITEGEADAMSISQLQRHEWPVVSIPNGTSSAKASIQANLEFINSFDEVVLCFDSDEPGRKAARAAATVIKPGICRIVQLPRKDANDMLVANEGSALLKLLWQGQVVRPDGIIAAADVDLSKDPRAEMEVWEWPFPEMTKVLCGRRSGELVTATSGSGSGKSTFVRECIYHDLMKGRKVGVIMLEEGVHDTIHDLMSLTINKPIRRIMAARKINERLVQNGGEPLEFNLVDTLQDSEYAQAAETIRKSNLYLYDHFGSLDCATLIEKIRYMVTGLGCKHIYLDHISIVISGNDSGNERKDIDLMMTNLRSLVEETNCHLVAVSHLRKSNGTAYEEGGRITGQDLRGSGSILQLSDSVLGFERNQQAEERTDSNLLIVRSIKDRFGGYAGVVSGLRYVPETGRLEECKVNDLSVTEDDTLDV